MPLMYFDLNASSQTYYAGEDAVYTPAGGGAVALRAIYQEVDEVDNLLESGVVRTTLLCEVERALIAVKPPANSTIQRVATGETRRIKDARIGKRGLVWILDLASPTV